MKEHYADKYERLIKPVLYDEDMLDPDDVEEVEASETPGEEEEEQEEEIDGA